MSIKFDDVIDRIGTAAHDRKEITLSVEELLVLCDDLSIDLGLYCNEDDPDYCEYCDYEKAVAEDGDQGDDENRNEKTYHHNTCQCDDCLAGPVEDYWADDDDDVDDEDYGEEDR